MVAWARFFDAARRAGRPGPPSFFSGIVISSETLAEQEGRRSFDSTLPAS
jgi:hypothetical protein